MSVEKLSKKSGARRADDLHETRALMAALGRMPPKPHQEMKLGKATGKKAKSPVRKRASAKPKTS
jgi:hypothetical protein